MKRAEKLHPSGAMARADYETILSALEVAQANISVGKSTILQAEAACSAAEAQLAKEQSNLNYCTIKSPVEGVVIDRRVNVGQTVVSSMSTPSLFLIAKDLRKMQVWVSVNEADIGKIREGMKVEFTVDTFPGEIFNGAVSKIRLNASLTQNVVTYVVEVQADNSNLRLIPYLTANTRFILRSVSNEKIVSNAALRWVPSQAKRTGRKGGKTGTVWTLDPGGKPVPHQVEIVMTDGIRSAVKTDLPEGTQLITGIAAAGNGPAQPAGGASPFLPQMAPKKR
jgi:HlyD family secretion protein